MDKNQSKLNYAILIVLVVVFIAVIFQIVTHFTNPTTDQPSNQSTSNIYDSNKYFLVKLPEGFDKIGSQQFSSSTNQEILSTYFNAQTGDYFEIAVNEQPLDASVDKLWTYYYNPNTKTLDIDSKDACNKQSIYQCKTSPDGRLDIAMVISDKSKPIPNAELTFHFGNINDESSSNFDYVNYLLKKIKLSD